VEEELTSDRTYEG